MDAAFLDLSVPTRDAAGHKTVADEADLIAVLQEIVGRWHVLTSPEATRRLTISNANCGVRRSECFGKIIWGEAHDDPDRWPTHPGLPCDV